jgi:hypothetical protein
MGISILTAATAASSASSFLKKGSKKLLQIASGDVFNREARMLSVIDKSFFVLFFKKELLSSTTP